jgi:cellobiose phosphorylase
MYRLLVETLAGLNLEGTELRLTPQIPTDWPGFKMSYRYRKTVYHITIQRSPNPAPPNGQLILDGTLIAGIAIPLIDDQREHQVTFSVPPSLPNRVAIPGA